MAFAPDGRLFYNEQYTGDVRIVTPDGELQEEPFLDVEIFPQWEWGLIGLALDPEFETNHYVYISSMEPVTISEETNIAKPMVMRFTDLDGRGVDPKIIIGDLPESDPEHPFFSGIGNIGFGPDGYLYISVGDYELMDVAQDLSVPQGKILRVRPEDGSAALDNPFVREPGADPRIFAYGFDEVFNFAFHPRTGEMYATDSGAATCDELNVIKEGENYGWPLHHEFRFSDCSGGQVTQPIHFFALEGKVPLEGVVAPIGLEFVSGDVYPLIGDSLLVCERKTHILRRLVLGGDDLDQVVEDDVVVEDCGLDIAISADGTIYYGNETEIRRLVPVEQVEE
jgi:glucose/arabinose dehydrogenase